MTKIIQKEFQIMGFDIGEIHVISGHNLVLIKTKPNNFEDSYA